MTTKPERDKLRALHEAATHGEWFVEDDLFLRCGRQCVLDASGCRVDDRANLRLAAASHNALIPLLDRLEELERELESWREWHRKQYELWEPQTPEPDTINLMQERKK